MSVTESNKENLLKCSKISIVNKLRGGGKWDPQKCSIKPEKETVKRGQDFLKKQVEKWRQDGRY